MGGMRAVSQYIMVTGPVLLGKAFMLHVQVFWDVLSYWMLKVYTCFEEKCVDTLRTQAACTSETSMTSRHGVTSQKA